MSDHSPSNACPKCGAALPSAATSGLCPRCLMAEAMLPTRADAPSAAANMLTPAELAPHFPQLEILACLGRGGMGVVYKARQKTLNRFVALKLLAPERVTDAKFAERFTHEAQALAALNHPSIVTIHDFGQAGGFYYLLMEFVDGVNLRQAMKAGRFTPEQALAVVPPVCEALQYAHEHGIVHRDIKPENLLLDKDGRVKIADFGIAKILGAPVSEPAAGDGEPNVPNQSSALPAQPTLASLAGTPQYMAPEQKAHRATDHRADIYSLGVVLYELLTGELPADKLQPPSRKLQIDVRLDEIVLRALESTPELRYQTAGEFRTQVEAFAHAGTAQREPAGKQSWANWSSGQPPLIRDICSHMTKAERGEVAVRSWLFAVWNAVTWFAPFFACMFLPSPLGWIVGFCCLVIGLSFYPFLLRLMPDFLVSTQWAREQGITLRQLYQLQRTQRKQGASGIWFLVIAGTLGVILVPLGMFYFMSGAHSASSQPAISWAQIWDSSAVTTILMTLLGSTLLGWINVRRIRRSEGMLPGLGIAVFEGLFFPLLAFSALFGWGIFAGLDAVRHVIDPSQTEFSSPGKITILVMTALLVLAADLKIVALVWRTVNRPSSGTSAVPLVASQRPGSLRVVLLFLIVLLTASVLIIGVKMLSHPASVAKPATIDATPAVAAKALKPIPPEAVAIVDAIRALPQTFVAHDDDPDPVKSILAVRDAKSRELAALLKGTEAEALVDRGNELAREIFHMATSPDSERRKAINKECEALEEKIWALTHPAEKGAAEVVPASLPSRAPRLQFRIVADASDADAEAMESHDGKQQFRLRREVLLDDAAVADAKVGGTGEATEIDVTFTEAGGKRFAEITGANVGKQIAIVVDGKVLSAPMLRSAIPGGRAQITGRFTAEEAEAIAKALGSPYADKGTKPIPQAAVTIMEAMKALNESYGGRLADPETMTAFRKDADAKFGEMANLLRGTEAQVFMDRLVGLNRELSDALKAKDGKRREKLESAIATLDEKIWALVHHAAAKAARPVDPVSAIELKVAQQELEKLLIEIPDTQARLAAALTGLKENHPAVIELKAKLSALEQKAERLRAVIRSGAAKQ